MTTATLPPALQELTRFPQWVTWRFGERDGKETKFPYNPKTGELAAVDDSTTWASYAVAEAVASRYNGLGFVFTAATGLVGIDLDKCRNPETGAIEPWARALVDRLASYTEISVSARGLHVFVRGTLPPGGRRKGAIEMYDQGRYFVVTGDHLPDTPTTIEERRPELAALHTEIFGPPAAASSARPPRPPEPTDLDDDAIIARAANATTG